MDKVGMKPASKDKVGINRLASVSRRTLLGSGLLENALGLRQLPCRNVVQLGVQGEILFCLILLVVPCLRVLGLYFAGFC